MRFDNIRRFCALQSSLSAKTKLLLNKYPNAAAAYSLRKLDTSYSGSAVRVRRSYNNGETDIGFSGNDLDTTALLNHCVPSAIQAKYNDCMLFDNVNDSVLVNTAFDWDGTWDISFSVFINDLTEVNINVLGANTDSSYGITYRPGENEWEVYLGGFSDGVNSVRSGFNHAVSMGVIYDMRFTYDGTNVRMYINGSLSATRGLSTPVASVEPIAFGRRNVSNFGFRGSMFDVDIINNGSNFYASAGDGNANGNWTNSYGGTGGTVSGSPANFTGQDFNGFVTTWYDQSGATIRNANQSVASAQGKIFSNGSVILEAGKPAIEINTLQGWDQSTNDASGISGTVGRTMFFVCNSQSDTAATQMFAMISGLNNQRFIVSTEYSVNLRSGIRVWDVASDGHQVFSITGPAGGSSSDIRAWRNGAELTPTSTTAGNYNTNAVAASIYSNFVGTVQSIIVYASDKTSEQSDIENLLNSYWGVY